MAAKEFLSTPSARRATKQGKIWAYTLRNFYPRPPRGGRPGADIDALELDEFLSTPSARRATFLMASSETALAFLSTPSARRATRPQAMVKRHKANFYPRPPRGGRQTGEDGGSEKWIFLSTPSARRATGRLFSWCRCPTISIHALREEGDRLVLTLRNIFVPISIHALREEGDLRTWQRACKVVIFLSTPSARRATRDGSRKRSQA